MEVQRNDRLRRFTKGILLINTSACDILQLETTLPCPIWPFKGNMVMKTEIAAGQGEAYIKKWFPKLKIKIIDLSSHSKREFY